MSFTQQIRNGVVFHTADAFTAAGGVAHGFATRLGGVSTGPYAQLNLGITRPDERAAVRENYHRFCAAIGADVTSLVMTHQVHEDTIRQATQADVLDDLLDPLDYQADGLLTNQPGLCLTIYYADPGENLWEIAKAYHTAMQSVLEANSQLELSQEDAVSKREMLLIPILSN